MGPLLALAAFVVCLYQNPSQAVSTTVFAYDGWHYKNTVQMLVASILEATHRIPAGAAAAQGLDLSILFINMLLDGPLLPFLGSIPWLVLGKIPTASDTSLFLAVESLCHAASTWLVYALGLRLFHKKRFAVVASITWMLYPSAVIGAGTFMSEVPLTSALLLLVFCLLKTSEAQTGKLSMQVFCSAIAGMVGSALFVSKPALALAIFGLVGLFGFDQLLARTKGGFKRALLGYFLPLTLGFLVIVGAWGSYTYGNNGRIYFAASRVPTFNVVKGSEPTADGWGTTPLTPIATKYSSELISVGAALGGVWSQAPADCLNLLLRKPERLWGLPWNDYHYKFFGMSIALQVWWHRMLLLGSVVGAAVFIGNFSRSSHQAKLVALSCLGIVVAHLVYLPFETMSRYGFSTMPFIVLLAVLGLKSALTASQAWRFSLIVLAANVFLYCCGRNSLALVAGLIPSTVAAHWLCLSLTAVSLVAVASALQWLLNSVKNAGASPSLLMSKSFVWALVLLFCTAGVAHVFNDSETREWAAILKPGQSAARFIKLPERTVLVNRYGPASSVLLVVDGDQEVEGATITVNGHKIDNRLESLYLFDPGRADMLVRLQLHARLCRQPLSTVRQWRAVPVPPEWLKYGGSNEVRLSVPLDARRAATIYGDFPSVSGKVLLSSHKYISNGRCFHEMQSLDLRAIESKTAFAPTGDCFYERDGKLQEGDLASAQGRQFGTYRIYLTMGVMPPPAPRLSFATHADFSARCAPVALTAKVALNSSLAKAKQVSISAGYDAKHLRALGVMAAQIIINGGEGEIYSLPAVPRLLGNAASELLTASIPTGAFTGGISSMQVAFFGNWPGENDFGDVQISVQEPVLPALPVGDIVFY